MSLRDTLRTLGSGRPGDGRHLTAEESYRAFAKVLGGEESDIQVAGFLMALRMKGVTVEELLGGARALRDSASLPCQGMEGLVCIGSPHDGHDQAPPLEVASGLVAAGAGARVLVIADRCVPPRRGLTAASVLEHLETGLTYDPREAEDWVLRTRFAAVGASGVLPALLGLRKVRGALEVRTPLATIEKLIAPPSAALVVGAERGAVLGTAVEVMQGLGHRRGIAIQGLEGGVVPGVTRRTRGIELAGGHLTPLSVEPGDFGLADVAEPELPMFGPPEGEDGTGDNKALVAAAGEITATVLAGDHGPARMATLMGAAVILKAAGRAMTLAEGVDEATRALDSGAAREVLVRLRELSSHPPG